MTNEIPILGRRATPPRTEVCRSFSYKLNLANHGGPAYESTDFFASRKQECATEDAAIVSQELFAECVAEVRGAVAQFIAEMQRRKAQRPALTGSGNAREFENWRKA